MATVNRTRLQSAFKNSRVIAPLCTGGPVAITQDGSRLVTCVGEEAVLTDIQEGTEICRFAGDSASITALCIPPSASHLIVFTSTPSLRIYELPSSGDTFQKHVQPVRVVARAHDAPVHVCRSDPTSTYLASGSADGVVKVWDIARGYVTHVFKGHGGVVSALVFNLPFDPSSVGREQKMQLITASVDTRIRIFDLSSSASKSGGTAKPEAILEEHASVPRGLDVTRDGKWLVTGGRDSLVFLWDISSKSPQGHKPSNKGKGKEKLLVPNLVKTIPVHERVEAVGFLRDNGGLVGSTSKAGDIQIYTGGEKGVIKIWDARSGSVLFTLGQEQDAIDEEQEEQRQILDVLYIQPNSTVVSVHADQNILFHSLATRSLTRQLVGFNDEIVDAAFLSPYSSSQSGSSSSKLKDTHIALATNSSLIRVYSTSQLDARLLSGHSEIVLCLDRDSSGGILVSGSKDSSARIWIPVIPPVSEEVSAVPSVEWRCAAICEGHAESVGAIAISRTSPEDTDGLRFMFTGSQDKTIKMWDLSSVSSSLPSPSAEHSITKCKSLTTHKAHEKDINSIDVSPNDKLLVSGSQDRTAKIWEIEYTKSGNAVRGEFKLMGTCKGHKRGVWSVKFGRTERVLATGSGDKTVKLWSLDDFSCLKTFEGHTNSVLRVDFINAGMQLVSAASDGLVKIWNIKEEQCTTTLDNHEDKVWALAVSSDERTIVSGAADSIVTFWEDCTQEQEQEKEAKRAEMVLKDQDFMNYISLHDYRNAILLALAMSQPGRLFSLFKSITSASSPFTPSSITGHSAVDEVLRTLSGSDLARLLRFIRDWNANAKTSGVAQRVLHAIVKLRAAEDIMNAFSEENSLDKLVSGEGVSHEKGGSTALRDTIEGLVPYTERHLARMEKLVQESYVIDYLLAEMDDGMFGKEYDFEGEEVTGMDIDTAVGVGA